MTDHMSASEHVCDVISRCAQSIHAERTLRCHGVSDEMLQVVYKSVILSKLLYASSIRGGDLLMLPIVSGSKLLFVAVCGVVSIVLIVRQ